MENTSFPDICKYSRILGVELETLVKVERVFRTPHHLVQMKKQRPVPSTFKVVQFLYLSGTTSPDPFFFFLQDYRFAKNSESYLQSLLMRQRL